MLLRDFEEHLIQPIAALLTEKIGNTGPQSLSPGNRESNANKGSHCTL